MTESVSRSAVEANACADRLAAAVLQFAVKDRQWRTFGFRRPPRRGIIWDRFVSAERLAVETFLLREFAILATAMTIRSLQSYMIEEWRQPLVARMLQGIVGDKPLRTAFRFAAFAEASAFLEEGVGRYLAAASGEWTGVLLSRAPKVQKERFRAGVFLGAALLLEPTQSMLPGVGGAARQVCLASDPRGRVTLSADMQGGLLATARRLLELR